MVGPGRIALVPWSCGQRLNLNKQLSIRGDYLAFLQLQVRPLFLEFTPIISNIGVQRCAISCAALAFTSWLSGLLSPSTSSCPACCPATPPLPSSAPEASLNLPRSRLSGKPLVLPTNP